MNIITQLWREFRCKNHSFVWMTNVYGDAINHLNCRSIWKCEKCGKLDYRKHLVNLP